MTATTTIDTQTPASTDEFVPELIYIRNAGVGFHVDVISATANTVRLAVLARHGKVVLDEFDVPREKALDAIHHTSLYSAKYREALT